MLLNIDNIPALLRLFCHINMAAIYEYQKLTEPDAIRLIVLDYLIDLGSSLQCALQSTSLSLYKRDFIGKYTILSYVWGIHSGHHELPSMTRLSTLQRHLTLHFAISEIIHESEKSRPMQSASTKTTLKSEINKLIRWDQCTPLQSIQPFQQESVLRIVSTA
jgi:hypothetical protein